MAKDLLGTYNGQEFFVGTDTPTAVPNTSDMTAPASTLPQPTGAPPSTTDLQAVQTPELPQPKAPDVLQNYVGSLNDTVDINRKAVEEQYKMQLDEINKQQEAAQKKIDMYTNKQETMIQGDINQLTKPFQADLERAERNRLFINENFQANQSLVRELETLLTQSNNMMRELQGSKIPGLAAISQSPRAIQAIQDVSARVGVIQAVMSARSGQIAEGYRMIDRSISAVNADRQDRLNYFQTLNNFYEKQKDEEGSKLFQLNQTERTYINKQIGLIEGDLERSEKTADYIKQLMIDPASAKFMADAGVTLNDSVEQIQQKMADQSEREMRINEAKQNKQEAFEAGITTQYYNKDGSIIRTSDGWEFKDPQEFQQLTGMSLEQAQSSGMISEYNANTIANREQVLALMNKYWDAGITPADDITTAVQKAQRSRSYQLSLPRSSGGGSSGKINDLANAVLDGSVTLTSLPADVQEQVRQRVQQIQSGQYGSEQMARYDYNYDIENLKNLVASNDVDANPIEQINYLQEQYGGYISPEEITGAVLDAYGIQPVGAELLNSGSLSGQDLTNALSSNNSSPQSGVAGLSPEAADMWGRAVNDAINNNK